MKKLVAFEFVEALNLSEAQAVKKIVDPALPGLIIYRLQIPGVWDKSRPASGIQILRQEIVDVDQFDVLVNTKSQIIAIMAVNGGSYYDLSDYLVPVELLQKVGQASGREEWASVNAQIKEDKGLIEAYQKWSGKNYWKPRRNEDGAINVYHKSYLLASIDKETGKYWVGSFDPRDIQNLKDDHRLMDIFQPTAGQVKVVFPIFPSVYSPKTNFGNDHKTAKRVFEEVLRYADLKDGDNILDSATGTGFLMAVESVAAQLRGIKLNYYAYDINPLAVANAKTLAKIVGVPLHAKVSNTLLAFGDVQFKFISANGPMHPDELPNHVGYRGSFDTVWDHGYAGINYLADILRNLGKVAAQGFVAIHWNEQNFAILRAFRKRGFNVEEVDDEAEAWVNYRITGSRLTGERQKTGKEKQNMEIRAIPSTSRQSLVSSLPSVGSRLVGPTAGSQSRGLNRFLDGAESLPGFARSVDPSYIKEAGGSEAVRRVLSEHSVTKDGARIPLAIGPLAAIFGVIQGTAYAEGADGARIALDMPVSTPARIREIRSDVGEPPLNLSNVGTIEQIIHEAWDLRSAAGVDTTKPVGHEIDLKPLVEKLPENQRPRYLRTLGVVFEILRKRDNAYFQFIGDSYGLRSDEFPEGAKVMNFLDTRALGQDLDIEGGGSFYNLEGGDFVNVMAALIFNATVARMNLDGPLPMDRIGSFLKNLTRNQELEVSVADLKLMQHFQKTPEAFLVYRRFASRAVPSDIDAYLRDYWSTVKNLYWMA